jgi:MerR family transcriptional regulator, heat shock protein HspR
MKEKKLRKEFTEEDRKNMPLYTIGVVADLMGTTEQTVRLYEKRGLIRPARKNKNRFYSENDIKWLQCLRDLIHIKKINIEGIIKLLDYAPCWEITACSRENMDQCSAYIDRTKQCWERNKMIYKREYRNICENCVVFLSRSIKNKTGS